MNLDTLLTEMRTGAGLGGLDEFDGLDGEDEPTAQELEEGVTTPSLDLKSLLAGL